MQTREERNTKNRERYQKNKEKILENNRRWYQRNREQYLEGRKAYYQAHKKEYLRRGWEYRQRIKQEVFTFYSNGTMKCRCCGEDHIEFLTINHIHGNGRKHRREISGGRGGDVLYKWLKKNNFPDGFEILCYNCNCSLGHSGYCPHEEARKEYAK